MSKKREHERALFEAFLKVHGDFAGEPVLEWHQPENENDFPDIVGRLASGRSFGAELAEWLNEEEIRAVKQKESIEDNGRGAGVICVQTSCSLIQC